MIDPEVDGPEEATDEVVEMVALDDEAPAIAEREPMICDPVIGFVCPKER